MADYLVTDTELTSIADAIRTAGETSGALTFPAGFISAINAIPGGGGGDGLEYETGVWTPASRVTREFLSFSKTHSEAPVLILLSDAAGTQHDVAGTAYIFLYADLYKLWGCGIPYLGSGFRYGFAVTVKRSNGSNFLSIPVSYFQYDSDDPGDSGTSYPRYYAIPTGFYPKAGTTEYWRPERTYKWIAVWRPTS